MGANNAVVVKGVHYASIRDAARALGLAPSLVEHRCDSICWPRFKWAEDRPDWGFGQAVGKDLIEPRHWSYDGGVRREPVIDPNRDRRVVRYVGWVTCPGCHRHHFSPDVRGVRICAFCGGAGAQPIPRTSGHRQCEEDEDF